MRWLMLLLLLALAALALIVFAGGICGWIFAWLYNKLARPATA